MAIDWNTPTLTDDLVLFISGGGYSSQRFITVKEVVIHDNGGRADVLLFPATFKPAKAIILEVKVSRADLLSDLRANKWRKYLDAGAVVFCFPLGMAEPHEIPKEAGVLVRGEKYWNLIRRPMLKGVPVSSEYLHKRMIFALSRDMMNCKQAVESARSEIKELRNGHIL